jgi:hypothetical protein
MVCSSGTVRNSLGGPIQFMYGEDRMDGALESQYIETFGVSDKVFERNYHVDITNLATGFSSSGFRPWPCRVSGPKGAANLLRANRRPLPNFIFTRAATIIIR